MIWFLYEKWKDVIIFNFGYNRYLIQARKHKWTRKTQFRVASTTPFVRADCSTITEEHLKRAGIWE